MSEFLNRQAIERAKAREAEAEAEAEAMDDAPFVCPGCYAVGDQPCAPGCIDEEIRQEREDEQLYGPSDGIWDDEWSSEKE